MTPSGAPARCGVGVVAASVVVVVVVVVGVGIGGRVGVGGVMLVVRIHQAG